MSLFDKFYPAIKSSILSKYGDLVSIFYTTPGSVFGAPLSTLTVSRGFSPVILPGQTYTIPIGSELSFNSIDWIPAGINLVWPSSTECNVRATSSDSYSTTVSFIFTFNDIQETFSIETAAEVLIPTISIASVLEEDNIVNATEDNDVVVSGTTTNVVDGSSIIIVLSDGTNSVTKTATVTSNSWTTSLADISTFLNGTINITATVTGTDAQATKAITLDNTAPTISIASVLEGDNRINATEDNDVVISGTTTGVEDGRLVTVVLSDGTNSTIVTATVTSGSWATAGSNISTWINGTITVTANVSDLAGNPAVQATKTLTLDNVVPTISIATTLEGNNIVDATEDNDVVVSGTTSGVEDGRTVTVVLSDSSTNSLTKTATVSSGSWTLTPSDISTWTNGNINITANVSDLAGNAAVQATKIIVLDNAPPVEPSGIVSEWNQGEPSILYSPTTGIDTIWSLGESIIFDIKE